jgi:hypothetical protein
MFIARISKFIEVIFKTTLDRGYCLGSVVKAVYFSDVKAVYFVSKRIPVF